MPPGLHFLERSELGQLSEMHSDLTSSDLSQPPQHGVKGTREALPSEVTSQPLQPSPPRALCKARIFLPCLQPGSWPWPLSGQGQLCSIFGCSSWSLPTGPALSGSGGSSSCQCLPGTLAWPCLDSAPLWAWLVPLLPPSVTCHTPGMWCHSPQDRNTVTEGALGLKLAGAGWSSNQ